MKTGFDFPTEQLKTRHELHKLCAEFVRSPILRNAIGDDNAAVLSVVLVDQVDGVRKFRDRLHAAMREAVLPTATHEEVFALGEFVQALTYWDSTHEGRWKQTTEPQRERWLAWSVALAEKAMSQPVIH